MNRQGLLITFFTFIFLSSIVAMTYEVKSNLIQHDHNKKWGLGIARIGDSFDQIEDGLLSLAEKVGGLEVECDYNYLQVSFSLPRASQQSLYQSRAADFNRFVRRFNSPLDFNFNGEAFDLDTFSFWESDVNFGQRLESFRDENAFYISPRIPLFDSYQVELRLLGQDFNGLSYSLTECSDCNVAIGLRVEVKDENGETVDSFAHSNLDAFNYSEVLVQTTSPGGNDFNLSILPVGVLSVRNDSNSASDFNALIDFGSGNRHLPRPHFSHGLIEVGDRVLRAEKK